MSGTIIKVKYSNVTNQPASNVLAVGEQAYSFSSDRMFIGKQNGASIDPIIIGGEYYTNMMNQTLGVLTASSAVLVDANKWVDHLISGSLQLTTSGGSGQVVTSVTTSTTLASAADTQLPTALAVKTYVDNSISGTISLNTLQDVLITSPTDAQLLQYNATAAKWENTSMSGSATITKSGVLTLNTLLDGTTGKVSGSYGSTTAIPVLTVAADGRVTAITTASISTTLNVAATSGSGTIALATDTFTIAQGSGITTSYNNTSKTTTVAVDSSVARNTNTLDYFSSTTSAQLATVISDETGTGYVVFNTSPSFVTSVTTSSTTFAAFNTTATTVNAFGAATTLNLGAGSGTTTVNNNLVVGGNLTVNGTTTSVNSTTTTLTDPVITLGKDSLAAGDAHDRGIEFKYGDGTNLQTGFFGMDTANSGRFVYIKTGAGADNLGSNYGDAQFAAIYGTQSTLGNLTLSVAANGTISTGSGDLTLTASTSNVKVTGNLTVSGTLTLTNNPLAITSGGTGTGTPTASGIWYTNAAGTALSFLTGSQYQIVQFNSSGVPIASATIDGGTF